MHAAPSLQCGIELSPTGGFQCQDSFRHNGEMQSGLCLPRMHSIVRRESHRFDTSSAFSNTLPLADSLLSTKRA